MSDVRERVRAAKKPRAKKEWEPPAIEDFIESVEVLAFDQSLASTGWVLFTVDQGDLRLHQKGTLRNPIRNGGHIGTMDKADWLKSALVSEHIFTLSADLIVGEQTPVQGWRLESSLIAGYVLRQVFPKVEFVNRRTALSLLLPPEQRSDKKYAAEVVKRYDPVLGPYVRPTWNEHERDALMLGLTAIHRSES